MSAIGETLKGIRRLMLMDADVQQMKTDVGSLQDRVANHNDRLIRIESLIEFGQRMLPR